jgi:hypothetical protein
MHVINSIRIFFPMRQIRTLGTPLEDETTGPDMINLVEEQHDVDIQHEEDQPINVLEPAD